MRAQPFLSPCATCCVASLLDTQPHLDGHLPVDHLIVLDLASRLVTSNQCRLRNVFEAFSIAVRIASSLDFVDEPVSSICL
jgi:hypothetical protein